MSTSVEKGAVATVRAFLQRIHDPETRPEALKLLHDDVVFHEPAGLPYGGEYEGPEGFLQLITNLREHVTPKPLGPRTMIETGEGVVLLHDTVKFTSNATGRSAVMDCAELYTVRDGRIADADIYYKDPAAVRALAP